MDMKKHINMSSHVHEMYINLKFDIEINNDELLKTI
jgi:hypothetical protein